MGHLVGENLLQPFFIDQDDPQSLGSSGASIEEGQPGLARAPVSFCTPMTMMHSPIPEAKDALDF